MGTMQRMRIDSSVLKSLLFYFFSWLDDGHSLKILQILENAKTFSATTNAIGHGIPDSYLDKVREVAKQFFALPVEVKKKYSRADTDGEGYGGDLIVSEKQVLDWSDRLALKVLPEDERRLNLWPESPAGFREILQEYSMKMKYVLDLLFKAIAKSLNLQEGSFLNQFGERAHLIARINFYPPCPRPEQVLGLKPHSDKSGMTVLLQDKEVEGLHVLKNDQWFRVPIIPNALVVNVGDQMQCYWLKCYDLDLSHGNQSLHKKMGSRLLP
ncbi:hypothetical protein U1Q18_028249 [Sarracenia purpurea var. burkii]